MAGVHGGPGRLFERGVVLFVGVDACDASVPLDGSKQASKRAFCYGNAII